MKVRLSAKKLFAVVLAVLCMVLTMTACGSEVKEPTDPSANYPKLLGEVKSRDTYTENELYIWNSITERKVYCREVIPASYNKGDKLPIIVYVHGFNGSADALISEPETLAADGIAGFTFECCGGNKVTAMSDGKEICPAHYSSRATDLETALEYVKTLDYVDKSQIYIYGQSYGGVVCMSSAPRHNDDIAGMILESTGISKEGNLLDTSMANGVVTDYLVPQNWQEYITSYYGNVILCNSVGDSTISIDVAEYTTSLFQSRDSGSMKLYSCPEGEHAFNSFSEEGKKITYDAIREFVLGK